MKSDLTKTLRKIIREEVETAVRTEFVNFVSLMGEAKKPKKKVVKSKPKKKVVSETSIKKMVDDILPNSEVDGQVQKNRFSTNPILNDILNETQGGLPNDPTIPPQPQPKEGHEEYPTMTGGVMDKTKMAQMLGYGGEVPMATPEGIPVSDVPNAVTKAMTRDYGDLMKAIDKKKGGTPLKG